MPQKGYKDIKKEVIIKRTGKDYKEWKEILDNFNVIKNGHKASAEYLKNIHGVNPWWCQVIVVRYEHEKRLRK